MSRSSPLLLTALVLVTSAFASSACSSSEGQTNAPSAGAGGSAQQAGSGGELVSGGGGGTSGASVAGTSGGRAAGGAAPGGAGGNSGSGSPGGAGAGGSGGSGGSGGAVGLMGTQDIMVLGSSNELITCWRAFLWQKLQAAEIKNFDLVGGVTDGPDCNVAGYDKDLQAQSGQVISNLPASKYQEWFSAHPPDLILMHFGGADLLQGMPVDGVMKAYSLALEQARLVNPKVHLLIAQHTPQDSKGCAACDANLLEVNSDIVPWAAANTTAASPVTVVDLYTGLVPATDFSDGVHLNESGSQKVSDRWFAALKPLFKP